MKRFFGIMAAGVLCLSVLGCSKSETPEKNVSTAAAQEDKSDVGEDISEIPPEEELLAEAMSDGDTEMYEYEAQNNTHVMVYGDFSAQVRAVLPDYVADDSLSVAVVTLFQEMPFTLYLGQGGAEELEIGGIYKFEIEDTEIFGESLEYLEYIEPNWFLAKHNIRIKNVSPADPETEWGLICNRLSYRPMD